MTTLNPNALPYGDDFVPNLALTAQIAEVITRHSVQSAVDQVVAGAHKMATEAAQAAVNALWPYVERFASLDPETLAAKVSEGVRMSDTERQQIIDRAVAEARAVALNEVVVAIPDVLRVERAGSTEVKFTKDRDGRITGAVTKPAK